MASTTREADSTLRENRRFSISDQSRRLGGSRDHSPPRCARRARGAVRCGHDLHHRLRQGLWLYDSTPPGCTLRPPTQITETRLVFHFKRTTQGGRCTTTVHGNIGECKQIYENQKETEKSYRATLWCKRLRRHRLRRSSLHEGASQEQDPWVGWKIGDGGEYTTLDPYRVKVDEHGNTLGVDGSEIGVFEEGDKVRLSRLLQRHDGRRLEAEIGLEKGGR